MVVCIGNDGLAAFDACAQVELDNIASALLVKEQSAVVDDKASAIHAVGEFVSGGGPARDEVLL